MREALDFSSVGQFEESVWPRGDGRYRYMPYRSAEHYSMQMELRAGRRPRYYYDTEEERVSFTILACPEYGQLELRDFGSTPKDSGVAPHGGTPKP
jgi:hypothetical protein